MEWHGSGWRLAFVSLRVSSQTGGMVCQCLVLGFCLVGISGGGCSWPLAGRNRNFRLLVLVLGFYVAARFCWILLLFRSCFCFPNNWRNDMTVPHLVWVDCFLGACWFTIFLFVVA